MEEAEAHLNSPKELDRISQFVGTRLGEAVLGLDAAFDLPSNAGVSNVLEAAFAIYERQFTEGTEGLTVELGSIDEELEGIALAPEAGQEPDDLRPTEQAG